MGKGLLFWILMVLWLIFGVVWGTDWASPDGRTKHGPGNVLLFILLFLLGWGIFGFVVQ